MAPDPTVSPREVAVVGAPAAAVEEEVEVLATQHLEIDPEDLGEAPGLAATAFDPPVAEEPLPEMPGTDASGEALVAAVGEVDVGATMRLPEGLAAQITREAAVPSPPPPPTRKEPAEPTRPPADLREPKSVDARARRYAAVGARPAGPRGGRVLRTFLGFLVGGLLAGGGVYAAVFYGVWSLPPSPLEEVAYLEGLVSLDRLTAWTGLIGTAGALLGALVAGRSGR